PNYSGDFVRVPSAWQPTFSPLHPLYLDINCRRSKKPISEAAYWYSAGNVLDRHTHWECRLLSGVLRRDRLSRPRATGSQQKSGGRPFLRSQQELGHDSDLLLPRQEKPPIGCGKF